MLYYIFNLPFGELLLLELISIPVYVIIHELGHAVPAAIMSRKEVLVYIGSHGDKNNSFRLSIGLISLWFKYNPLSWKKGLCQSTKKDMSLKQQILLTAGGPTVPLIFAGILYILALLLGTTGAFHAFSAVFLLYSCIMFIVGMLPFDIRIETHGGRTIRNDGFTLRNLYVLKKYNKQYNDAMKLYNEKKYLQAGQLFKFLLNKKVLLDGVYRAAILSFIFGKDYEQASTILAWFRNSFNFNSDDYCNAGVVGLHTKEYAQAKDDFEKSLSLNADHVYSLNNLGYYYTIIKEYDKALLYLNKAVGLNATFAHAYCSRGLAKIKLGKTTEGLADIDKAKELDASNAYVYRNLGIYYFDLGNCAEALPLFKKALELDNTTHSIKEFIKEAEDCLLRQKNGY